MKQTNLCFLIKDDQVLLAMKKRGFGVGKWNGTGGKVKEGESVADAAVREIKEEIGVTVAPEDLEPAGTLQFDFDDNPEWAQTCEIFLVRQWQGDPGESEEMRPQWYPQTSLPFSEMWIDDPHWLPLVLAGKKIGGKFLFGDNGDAMLDFNVSEVG